MTDSNQSSQGLLEMAAFKSIAEEKTVRTGEYIFKEGEEDTNFYIIMSGEIEISIKKSDGGDKVVAYVKPGELLGEGVLTGKTLKPASAKAAGEVKLLVLTLEHFKQMADLNPREGINFLLKIMDIVNNRLHQSNVKLLALFEISKMLNMHRDDLKSMAASLIQQLLGLIKCTEGMLLLKNPYSEEYRTIYSTSMELNELTVAKMDLSKPAYQTTGTGYLLIVNLKQSGVIVLRRSLSETEFAEDHSRLVQLVADLTAGTIEEASRRAEEKAKNILHQKRYTL